MATLWELLNIVARIFARILNNKGLYIDHISGRSYVIKACPIIVCHAWSIFTWGGGKQIGVHDG